ncbi:MAG: DUF1232 domain-containing protein [Solirubrobacterales bacterium]|nr:DUF1232 domain-containing protein [Solirubrobacterales bacterium]
MSTLGVILVSVAAVVAAYAALVLLLLAFGRPSQARLLARFIPDCVVLLRRLIADPRVSRSRKGALLLSLAYLASPLDLIPDFIPILGLLDDAIVVALVLRFVLRAGGPELLDELWPGPTQSRDIVKRLAFGGPVQGRAN